MTKLSLKNRLFARWKSLDDHELTTENFRKGRWWELAWRYYLHDSSTRTYRCALVYDIHNELSDHIEVLICYDIERLFLVRGDSINNKPNHIFESDLKTYLRKVIICKFPLFEYTNGDFSDPDGENIQWERQESE